VSAKSKSSKTSDDQFDAPVEETSGDAEGRA